MNQKATIFVVARDSYAYREYIHKLPKEGVKYKSVDNPYTLRGHTGNNCKVHLISGWENLSYGHLHEIFHWARSRRVAIEIGLGPNEVHVFNTYYEADPTQDTLKSTLAKILLTEPDTYKQIMDNFTYDQKVKSLTSDIRFNHHMMPQVNNLRAKLWNIFQSLSKDKSPINGMYQLRTNTPETEYYNTLNFLNGGNEEDIPSLNVANKHLTKLINHTKQAHLDMQVAWNNQAAPGGMLFSGQSNTASFSPPKFSIPSFFNSKQGRP